MEQRQAPNPLQTRVATVILLMAGVVAVTPLVLAIAAGNITSTPRTGLVFLAAVIWLIVLVAYRSLAHTYEHRRRQVLRQEVADARRARLEATDAFQDKLISQQAILDRIVAIGGLIVEEGIIDPQLALNNLRLILSHAKDAQTQIDDAIIEARVAIGAEEASPGIINLRDEIEEIASPFNRHGVNIATDGPALFGETDAAMYRLIVRSLIAGAVDRGADQVGVTVASNGESVVSTVSDDGADCTPVRLDAVSALAQSLAATMGAVLEFACVLGRNQFSIAVPLAAAPDTAEPEATPMDVLGALSQSQAPADEPLPSPSGNVFSHQELITFVQERERLRKDSVAARRKRQLTAR